MKPLGKQNENRMEKNLNLLSKEDLITILDSLITERTPKPQPHNRIEVADFVIESNCETLSTCKKTMDILIKQHQNFFIERKKKAINENMGMFG